MAEEMTPIDAAVRMSRRHLLAALGLVLLMGVATVLRLAGDATAAPAGALWTLLPMVIVLLIPALASRGASKGIDAAALTAMHNDELRQASLRHAWRIGFFVVLGLQPVLAWAVSYSAIANGPALMACGTVTIGAVTVLATLLWYDR